MKVFQPPPHVLIRIHSRARLCASKYQRIKGRRCFLLRFPSKGSDVITYTQPPSLGFISLVRAAHGVLLTMSTPTSTFPIDEAYLVGGWLESFFWGEPSASRVPRQELTVTTCRLGLFTLLFAMTVYAIYRKRREGVNAITTASIVVL